MLLTGIEELEMPHKDPLGHHLFEQRLSLCPALIKQMLEHPVNVIPSTLSKNFVVTGIGSSEAHARFFAYLINRYTSSTATFSPIINFYENNFPKNHDTTLVVFSQALSPNAQLAINNRPDFDHLILFTGQIDKNNEIFQNLSQEKQTIIQFPVPDEKQLLIRILGPLCGYLSIIQFINHNWHNCIPECNKKDLLTAINKIPSSINYDSFFTNAPQGLILLMGSPLCEYSQNLAYKFLEGLFISMPSIIDYLSFAHGTLQQLINKPKLIIHFKQNSLPDTTLSLKADNIIQQTSSTILNIPSHLPTPWNIFEYELTLNYLILAGMKKWNINQINWPGKTLDLDLYQINRNI